MFNFKRVGTKTLEQTFEVIHWDKVIDSKSIELPNTDFTIPIANAAESPEVPKLTDKDNNHQKREILQTVTVRQNPKH